ncbi:MAG: prepilin-type N-terminal cleavage/methylation domain-containing protein [Myxococcales bacterium]
MTLPRHDPQTAGFTLLEVMVAVAILALCLSAVYSSQAGAIKMAHRSRKMGMAALMARCKMNEIEEQIANEGLPAVFDAGSDNCCEESEIEGITCSWEIEPVTLPETMFMPEDEEGAEGDDAPDSAESPSVEDTANMTPEELLAGGGSVGGSMDGMAMMAMSFVYPILKPSFESQIRRATVTVNWTEGSVEHSFDVTQFLVSGQPVELLEGVPDPNAIGDTTAAAQPGGTQ